MSARRTLIIRYRTRPDAAEENSRLVAGVVEEPPAAAPVAVEPPAPDDAIVVGSYQSTG